MRIARVEVSRFRGWESLTLLPRGHVLAVGEPRAGRSDLIEAIRRVLDPRIIRSRPSPWDVFRPLGESEDDGSGSPSHESSVSLALLELGAKLEDRLDGRLELLDPDTGETIEEAELPTGRLGIRLQYTLVLDEEAEQLDHRLEYMKSGTRVPRGEHDLLRAYVVDGSPPLQLRPEGFFRALAEDLNPDALIEPLRTFANDIADATDDLASSDPVQAALKEVANHGPTRLLNLDRSDPASHIGFTAENGSLAALLRAIQPTLDLGEAGPLPLSLHGSTTSAVFTAAEASVAARTQGAIVLADDFGEHLDGSSAEYLAARLRRQAGQLWLTTRQPEVLRAFRPAELVRLGRPAGIRRQFQLPATPDRAARVRQRYLPQILGPALGAECVVLLEGPHDMLGYLAVSHRRFHKLNRTPLSAKGTRFVPASHSGGDGGKHQLPGMALLARQLGLSVRVVLDHDKPGADDALIQELCQYAEMVVRLPPRFAIERALVVGIEPEPLRAALSAISEEHELDLEIDIIDDHDLSDVCASALKRKGGLHEQFVHALPGSVVPPMATNVLEQLQKSTPDKPLVTLEAP